MPSRSINTSRTGIVVVSTLIMGLVTACAPSNHMVGQPSSPRGDIYLPRHGSAPTLPDGRGGIKKIGTPYKVNGVWYQPVANTKGYSEEGIASWYGHEFQGRKTANGETFNMYQLSAAHKTLPLPVMARVTNLENGRSITVRINDRGPFVKSRLIDLSRAAADALGFMENGTARVRVETLPIEQYAPVTHANSTHTNAIQWDKTTPTTPANSEHTARFFVQLGAFSSKDNAQQLRNSYQHQHPDIHVQASNNPTIYRVRIGPLSNRQHAESTIRELLVQGMNHAIVVVD